MKMQSERGAILVHVAIGLLALISFSAFTVDYGQFWVSRRQAQNAADAGALAGAIARIYNDTSNPPSSTTSGVVWENAVTAAGRNAIWGVAPPSTTITVDYNCPGGVSTNCVVVDVFRDGTNNSSPLSTFFLNLVNIDTQGVRAHAVAEVRGANMTGCMRPVFLIDKYTDANGDGDYDAGTDTYLSPGWRVPEDIGQPVEFHENLTPSGYGQIDIANGTAGISEAWRHCASGSYRIGQTIDTKPGNSGGQKHAVQDLIDWDPDAEFNPSTGAIDDSCAPSCTCDGQCPYGGQISPRVIIVPVCSPLQADCRDGGPNNGQITITNFLSFFLLDAQDFSGKLVFYTVLVGTGGEVDRNSPDAPAEGTFLKVPVLIR
jgi:Flp pilus assembly protein TadG